MKQTIEPALSVVFKSWHEHGQRSAEGDLLIERAAVFLVDKPVVTMVMVLQ
jgi:hypothetical protein